MTVSHYKRLRGDTALDGHKSLMFTPFDPIRKRTEARVQCPDGSVKVVSKGAPQVVMQLVKEQKESQEAVVAMDDAVDKFASRTLRVVVLHQCQCACAGGLRALGVAEQKSDGAWSLVGLISMFDPPRDDSKATIDELRALGIRVKMVTGKHHCVGVAHVVCEGDQVKIGAEVARRLGMGSDILNCAELDGQVRNGLTMSDRIENSDGFGEVFPAHKHLVVSALQDRKHLVAMVPSGFAAVYDVSYVDR